MEKGIREGKREGRSAVTSRPEEVIPPDPSLGRKNYDI